MATAWKSKIVLQHVGDLRPVTWNTTFIEPLEADVEDVEVAMKAGWEAFFNADPFGVAGSPFRLNISSMFRNDLVELHLTRIVTGVSLEPGGWVETGLVGALGSPQSEQILSVDQFGQNAPLPNELRCCMTIYGVDRNAQPVEVADGSDPGIAVDRPMQRRTGRVFIGPLDSGTLSSSSISDSTPNDALRGAISGAVTSFHLAAQGPGVTPRLGVWSRADRRVYLAESIGVNNAWDIQNRSGIDPSDEDLTVIPEP